MIFDAVTNFCQPENGYRFSEDSVLLAEFVDARKAARAADFGAGCGVVGLCALEKGRAAGVREFFFVEQEPDFWEPLNNNINLYQRRTGAKLAALGRDWRTLTTADFGGPLDYVMANPPYFAAASGRPSRLPSIDAARRELHGDLAGLIESLARLTAPGGRAALMLPVRRRDELLKTLADNGFRPERLEMAGARDGGPPRLILVEAAPA